MEVGRHPTPHLLCTKLKGESQLAEHPPSSLFPDCRCNMTSRVRFLLSCLPRHDGLHAGTARQSKPLFLYFLNLLCQYILTQQQDKLINTLLISTMRVLCCRAFEERSDGEGRTTQTRVDIFTEPARESPLRPTPLPLQRKV